MGKLADAALPFAPRPPPARCKDLRGRAYFRLHVVGWAGRYRSNSLWWCLCTCGTRHVAAAPNLNAGKALSCGCWKRERDLARRNGPLRRTQPGYLVWAMHKTRRLLCREWAGYDAFLAGVGVRPSLEHKLWRFDPCKLLGPGNAGWGRTRREAMGASAGAGR